MACHKLDTILGLKIDMCCNLEGGGAREQGARSQEANSWSAHAETCSYYRRRFFLAALITKLPAVLIRNHCQAALMGIFLGGHRPVLYMLILTLALMVSWLDQWYLNYRKWLQSFRRVDVGG